MKATGASDDGRTVSRRRFVATTGASGLAVALAGCPDTVGTGTGENGTDESNQTTGETTGTVTETDGAGTVTWAFEPTAVQENGDAIRRALYDNGLSEEVDVELVPSDEDRDQRRAEFNRALSSEEPRPDLFLMDHSWVSAFAHRGLVQNLSELLDEAAKSTLSDEYFEGVTATARDYESGDLFGVPLFVDVPTMQYRVDLVEAAGYDPMESNWATEPLTWSEWSHVTADAYDSSGVEFGYTTQWDIYEGTACCTFNEVLSSWGGAYFGGRENLFGPVGDRPITVDADPVVRSLNMMRKFVHDEDFERLGNYSGGFAPTEILRWIESDARAPFVRGNAVMHRDWSGSLAATGGDTDASADPALGEDLGTMPMPYAVSEAEAAAEGAGGTTAALGAWHATVNRHSQNLDAVEQVLEASMEPAFQLELFALQGSLPPRPALFDTDEARSVDGIGQHMDTLRIAGENVMPRPVTPVWNDQASVIAQEANRAVAQEIPADQAMRDLKSSLEQIEETG